MIDSRVLLEANERFASTFGLGGLARAPRHELAVITCMDARIDPLALLGLEIGDAVVLRNAGGLVTGDVLRSLAVAHALLGVRAAIVIGHTECGLLGVTNDELRSRLGVSQLDLLPFSDLDESVLESVARIRSFEALPGSFAASGFVYDVHSGRLRSL